MHAVGFEAVELADEHDAVEDGHPEQGDEAHARRHAERQAPRPQRHHPADGRERNGRENQQRLLERAEGEKEQDENQRQRHGHGDAQPLLGLDEVLKLAAVADVVAGRQRQLLGQHALDILHHALHVAAAHVQAHGDAALAVLVRNLGRAVLELDLGHFAERHLVAVGQGDGQGAHVVDAGAVGRVEAQHQVEALGPFVDRARGGAGKAGGQHRGGVAHGQPVLGQAVAVEGHRDLGQAGGALGGHVLRPGDGGDEGGGLRAEGGQPGQVLAVNLDGHVLAGPGNQLVEAQLDGLRKLVAHAGQHLQGLFHFIGQGLAGVGGGPLGAGLEQDGDHGHFDGVGVGGDIGHPDAAHHARDFGELLPQNGAHLAGGGHRLAEGRAGGHAHLNGHVALVEGGDELAAKGAEQQISARQQGHGEAEHHGAVAQREGQQRRVAALHPGHELVGERLLGVGFTTERQGGHHGHVGERENQGPDDGEGHGFGHGPEHLALDAGQRQDGQVDHQDDDFAKGSRLPDAAGRLVHGRVHLRWGELG